MVGAISGAIARGGGAEATELLEWLGIAAITNGLDDIGQCDACGCELIVCVFEYCWHNKVQRSCAIGSHRKRFYCRTESTESTESAVWSGGRMQHSCCFEGFREVRMV